MDMWRRWQILLLAAWMTLAAATVVVSPGGAALAGRASIRLESASLQPNESATLTLEGVGFESTGLGALTVDVSYDPTAVSVTACEADPERVFDLALCGEEYAKGIARVTVIDAEGEAGDFTLAEITFTAGSKTGSQALAVRVETLADATGAELDVLVEGGILFIGGDGDSAEAPPGAGEASPNAGEEEDGATSGGDGEEDSSPVGEASEPQTSSADTDAEAGSGQPPEPAGERSEPATSGAGEASDEVEASDGATGDTGAGFPWWYVGLPVIAIVMATIGIGFVRGRRET